jgi:hypothetical protein
MYTCRSAAIFFDRPAIRYGGSGIRVTSTIFRGNITLHTARYIYVQLCGCDRR